MDAGNPSSASHRGAGAALAAVLRRLPHRIGSMRPVTLVLLGYASYILVGWLLLCLPIAHRAHGVSALDHLFIATSAMSTTGLATISVADTYNLFGQLVVLGLIQLGGVGYMTLGSFIVLSRRQDLSDMRLRVSRSAFALPREFGVPHFIRSVVLFTLVVEAMGALALWVIFTRAGVDDAVWQAIFHSVSAFCTAGFSLFNTSFEQFAGNFWLNAVVIALSYIGAVGFIVLLDLGRRTAGTSPRLTLTSRIILWFTLWASVIGTVLILVDADPILAAMPPAQRVMAAWFQAMTAMTTVGFNTVPIGSMAPASLFMIVVLMLIGASPSGTGGGLKSTTITALLGVMRSAMRGEREVKFWGTRVPIERLWAAVGATACYVIFLVAGLYLLTMTEKAAFDAVVFEAVSALGTVGLSMGLTGSLTPLGKLIIVALMFAGRVGPLTFGTAMFIRPRGRALSDDLAV